MYYKKQKSLYTEKNKHFSKDSISKEINSDLLKIDISNAEFSDFNNTFMPGRNSYASKNKST